MCQNLSFLSSFLVYLESNSLASREQVGQHLGRMCVCVCVCVCVCDAYVYGCGICVKGTLSDCRKCTLRVKCQSLCNVKTPCPKKIGSLHLIKNKSVT